MKKPLHITESCGTDCQKTLQKPKIQQPFY